MRKTASYSIALILFFIGLFLLDFFFGSGDPDVPFWQTEWFRWRMIMFSILIAGIIAYLWIDHLLKMRNSQMEFSRKLMSARENERRMLAAELHDDLQQDLHAIKLNIDRLRSLSSNGINEKLRELSDTITESIEKVRILSHSLYPTQLEKLGLKTAIEKLFRDAASLTGMSLNMNIGEIDDRFRIEVCIHIYRIIQEVLNNIIKHSRASRIDAEIYMDEVYLHIVVSDDGRGISDYSPKFKKLGGSFGLSTMYERVKVLKGSMDIKTGTNIGTKVLIYIPIRNNLELL